MQTLTFTQKLLRQRRFASYFIPLLALFLGLGSVQMVSAQAYSFSNVTITARTTSAATSSTTIYYGKRNLVSQISFNGSVLGGTSGGNAIKFDPANGGVLTLDAASFKTSGANSPSSATIYQYRVYLAGTAIKPSYSSVSLANQGDGLNFANAAAGVNLLTQPAVLGGGNYVVEIQAQYIDNDPVNGPTPISDPSASTGYMATFTVISPATTPAGGTTRWISKSDTDWLNKLNWSNGVPTRDSNAEIPGHATTDVFTIAPVLSDPNALYEVQTLTLENASNDARAVVRVGQSVGATLRIYGDLNNLGGGLLGAVKGTIGTANPATNSTLLLAGDALSFTLDANGTKILTGGNQVVRGLTTISDVRIEGIGIKGVINTISSTNAFTFNTTSAIVRTTFDDGTFTLNSSKTANVDLKDSGFLFGETNTAFVDGITLAERPLTSGVTQTFGNIGVDITPNRTIVSNVSITRTIGAPFSGPDKSTGPTPVAVKRQYGVSGDVNNNTISTVTVHYLNSASELNSNPEANLTIFKTSNNGVPFQLVGGAVNLTTKTVTKSGVGAINTITLGDKDNPLPVTLTSFDAKRVGADAVVTWETASEVNNKGFNVQVSIDGKEFRTIGFVASASPNSIRATTYSYTDTEKNKSGLRYYRLMQVDTDGTTASFTPRVVSFAGKASANAVVAYPNPFNSNDQLRVSLQAATAGKGQLVVTDMTGRTIRNEAIEVLAGTSDFALNNMADLKSGLYLIKLILPSGETKNLKVVKQ